jgi:ABC-type phosphate transport system substrate-binding protein
MEQTMNAFRTLLFAVTAVATMGFNAQAADVSGAGATFPYPIYSKWAQAYAEKTGFKLNYQSIGSGGGIGQIKAKTVDFGASDMPLNPADLEKAGLIQFPMVMGGVVPVVNVPGLEAGQLKLDGKLLAEIYLGNITKWNDPAITALNSGLKLPDLAIATVYRSDGSGTTFIFTHFLSEVSPEWKDKIGENTSVQFPYLLLTNQPGKDSWPITGATFILLHREQSQPDRAREVINFFDWALREGGELAEQLDYVPMPENVVKLIEQRWREIKGPDGKPVWNGRAS